MISNLKVDFMGKKTIPDAHTATVITGFLICTMLFGCGAQEKTTDRPRDYFARPHMATNESPMPVATGSNKKPIRQKKFEVIETGLEPMVNKRSTYFGPAPTWLNDDLFIVNATQEVPDADERMLQRLMAYDVKQRKASTLLVGERFICWNRQSEWLSVREQGYTNSPKYRFLRLQKNGQLEDVSAQPSLNPSRCLPEVIYPRHQVYERPKNSIALGRDYPLLESDGILRYIGYITSGNVNNVDKLLLIRPDDSFKELSIHGSEISQAMYLPHLDKYLLNWTESQGNSDTDQRLGGANWGRPYALAPYHLMSRDGTVDSIPYPTKMFEYGIRNFGVFVPTKVGNVLIAPNSRNSEYGLFLMQGDEIYRFFGGPRMLGLDGREGVNDVSLSPDGCKIAFNLFSDHRAREKQIVIINLCKEIVEK